MSIFTKTEMTESTIISKTANQNCPSAVIKTKPVQNNCVAGTPFRIKISEWITYRKGRLFFTNIYIKYMPFGLYILVYLKHLNNL